MAEVVEDIDPLQISFSNEKGFQPSTPSQGSPTVKNENNINNKITTPVELFHLQKKTSTKQNVIPSIVFHTPRSRYSSNPTLFQSQPKPTYRSEQIKSYQTRYSSTRETLEGSIYNNYLTHKYSLNSSLILQSRTRQRRREAVRRWEEMGPVSHLQEISRLNELINKVNSQVGLYNRLYTLKRK